MKLRPYQRKAVDRSIAHFKQSDDAACLVLPTGSGKSVIIAELAKVARGRVLVVAHVKELCEQNHEKFQRLGGHAGIYSAGLGQKDSSAKVTFAGIQSAARNLQDFEGGCALLIIDECHRVSGEEGSQYQALIEHLKKENPKLKVLGLTATPYRLGMGWCYQRHTWGIIRTEEERPFVVCVYEVTLKAMIEQGYLTAPVLEDAPIAQYDFSSLSPGPGGTLPRAEVNELLVRHRRVTESVIEQIVALTSEQRRAGVMIFAATVQHAKEVLGYLPKAKSALILGETPGEERDRLIRLFQQRELLYLVNVAVLTTGFDAPHVDFIALLRATESVSLYQQIIGRGLRLSEGKSDCLVIDYAGNGFDIFSPEVGDARPDSESVPVAVPCPVCDHENQFWGLLDEEGRVVEHYGRRCHGALTVEGGSPARCDYRFRFKECGKCNGENDIAARRCAHCDASIVDPDELLKDALRLKDAIVLRVSGMEFSQEGCKLKITYHDEDGASVSEKFNFDHEVQKAIFNRVFARRLASGRSPLELQEPEQALALRPHLPVPDFVVARKQKMRGSRAVWFRVQERVFDYQGRFRSADQS